MGGALKELRSRFLRIIAGTYLAFPVSFLVLSAVFFDIPASSIVPVLLMPFFYILSALCMVVGYGLWEMRRWSWYVMLFANVGIAYESAYFVTHLGETHHKLLSLIVWLAVLILLTYRVTRELRVPYFLPRIRWWESNTKYHMAVPVRLDRDEGPGVVGEILDISLRGCFVKAPDRIRESEDMTLLFKVFGQPIVCSGKVVWAAESTVTHPKGVGVRFDPLPRAVRRRLRIAIKRLARVSQLQKNVHHQHYQEELLRILHELESPPQEDQPAHVPR